VLVEYAGIRANQKTAWVATLAEDAKQKPNPAGVLGGCVLSKEFF
jgi:hypothetical protein